MTQVVLMNLQGCCSSMPKQYSAQKQKSPDTSFVLDKSYCSFLDAEWQQRGFWRSLSFRGKQTSPAQKHIISGHIMALHFLIHKQQDQPRGALGCSNLISSLGMSLRLFQSSAALRVISPSLSPFFFSPCFFASCL